MGRCQRIKSDGTRCKLAATGSHGLCQAHDPSKQEERRQRARKGGKTGGRGRPLTQINHVKDKILQLTEKVEKGDTLRGDAAVIFQGYNVYLSAVRTELKAKEQEQLEERLEALESALAARKSGYGLGA
jgi:hypothetical protein